MKKLHLVCNAHLDPVWLWEWEEGAAAAISTFRAAAEFCEEFEGFVFCHNEALLYQWTEEYDPALFARIQKLVQAGKWHIMGGWFLQPDCNMPSGESMLRQVLVGRRYFKEKFQTEPKVALNFDSFGHSRGLVQILQQCGYTGYLFMRPENWRRALPARNFRWRGFDGSEILAHRLDRGYNSHMGDAVKALEAWVQDNPEENVSLFTWGVGNHGGGPSRVDLRELDVWMKNHPELQVSHSTPEAFFRALEEEGGEYPVVDEDLRSVFVGCYTSQAQLKKLHRRLENLLFSTEKLLAAASAMDLVAYPAAELAEAERDLLTCQFHDTLPGTTIPSGAESARVTLCHGLEILSRLRLRGFVAMLSGQPKAAPGEIPVFVYNPHPYPVTGVFSCEFMPADQNWSRTVRNMVTVRQNGVEIPSQEEKPEVNMNLDWRKRIVFQATLEPSAMNRFDCVLHQEPWEPVVQQEEQETSIVFENGSMTVCINRETGLIDRYYADGVEYLRPGAFAPVVFADTPDPWYMSSDRFPEEQGRFAPAETRLAPRYLDGQQVPVPAVRIVENGPVRMVVEAEFCWNHSRLIQTYRLPRFGNGFEVEQQVYWNEADAMLKLEIPTTISGAYLGQGMFGSGVLPQDGTECVSQKWSGLFGAEHALTVSNTGTYGSHCQGDTMYLSVLRSPAYAAHPIEDRRLVHEDRFVPRVDQGYHAVQFAVCGGRVKERREAVDQEAQILNEAPYALNVFPGGEGEPVGSFLKLSDGRIQLSAMYWETDAALVVRLWNTAEQAVSCTVELPAWKICQEITLEAFRFRTYRVCPETGLTEVPAGA